MKLTCDRLVKFDLIESIESSLNHKTLMRLFNTVYEIKNIDSFIREMPSFPGSTEKIIRDEMLSVIGATLSIEGTIIDKDEMEEGFKKAESGEPLRQKEKEAENSRQAYLFIKEFVKNNHEDLKYSEQLIKQMHKIITDGLEYYINIPGQYRTNYDVTFGNPRKYSLCRSQDEIENAMNGLVEWLNRTNDEGNLSQLPFVRAILAHYYLVEIHPFPDGNGRTARALEALILYAYGVNEYCFWSLANFWSLHREKYIEHLHTIRQTLDPMPFLLWGLEGYLEEIGYIKGKILKKVKQLMFSDYIQYLLRNKRFETIKITQRIVDVMQLLIQKERIPLKKFMATPEISALYRNVSQSTRSRDIMKMARGRLIKIEENSGIEFIVPNYGLLERLRYSV